MAHPIYASEVYLYLLLSRLRKAIENEANCYRFGANSNEHFINALTQLYNQLEIDIVNQIDEGNSPEDIMESNAAQIVNKTVIFLSHIAQTKTINTDMLRLYLDSCQNKSWLAWCHYLPLPQMPPIKYSPLLDQLANAAEYYMASKCTYYQRQNAGY